MYSNSVGKSTRAHLALFGVGLPLDPEGKINVLGDFLRIGQLLVHKYIKEIHFGAIDYQRHSFKIDSGQFHSKFEIAVNFILAIPLK